MTINTPEMPKIDDIGVVGLASTYAAGTSIAAHSHIAHQIVHAISGTMRVSANDTLWFVPPGRALWMPAGAVHAIQCLGHVEMRTVYLSQDFPTPHCNILVVSVSALMREVLIRLATEESPQPSLLFADVLLNEIRQGVLEPLSLPIPKDPGIKKLAQHLQNKPADQTTLKVWAKNLGFSERNLIRVIRAETGMTYRELRRLTRIMVAIDKLSTGQSVTTTAFDVGFETPSAFIHAFKFLTGTTPRQFLSEN